MHAYQWALFTGKPLEFKIWAKHASGALATALASIQSLAWELPNVTGVDKTNNEKGELGKAFLVLRKKPKSSNVSCQAIILRTSQPNEAGR